MPTRNEKRRIRAKSAATLTLGSMIANESGEIVRLSEMFFRRGAPESGFRLGGIRAGSCIARYQAVINSATAGVVGPRFRVNPEKPASLNQQASREIASAQLS